MANRFLLLPPLSPLGMAFWKAALRMNSWLSVSAGLGHWRGWGGGMNKGSGNLCLNEVEQPAFVKSMSGRICVISSTET